MVQNKLDTLRIRYICEFLTRGGGTLEELLDYLNQRLESADQKEVKLRTLQGLIEKLRLGDFIHSLQFEPKKRREKLFKVTYVNKRYQWHKSSAKPIFGDLEDEERYTLPFLAGLLKKYETIPAVRKILDVLPETFNITQDEMKSASAFFLGGPELYLHNDRTDNYAARVIQLTINILGHINKKEQIEFMYSPVSIQDERLQAMQHHTVAPLYIRFYNDLYYLIAIDIEKKRISNFRIDQIGNLKVDALLNEDDAVITFDPAKLEKTYKIKDQFKHALGIWNHPAEDQLYELHIRFRAWAAGYIKKLKFHHSQRFVSLDHAQQTYTVSFQLKLGPERYVGQKAHERSPELAFFLGRFGDYVEIIKVTPI